MANLPDYISLQESLHNIDATMEASEAHGALCGILCAQGSADINIWQQHVAGSDENNAVAIDNVADELQQMYLATIAALNNEMAGFECLLADDEEKLADRVHSLAYWCQGYLYGLAVGGVNKDSKLPTDSAELVQDFIEISRVVFDDEDIESSEADYMELVEFVRVGVLLINEELQPLKRDKPVNTEQLH